ncbi:hypothetical protein [Actinoallomurus acaciae]|uniref:Integral membrane protein n=1 Tax=Actinoallomurus acaciae TaxID=502577 RepID=A0ABV5YL93_9ACTN
MFRFQAPGAADTVGAPAPPPGDRPETRAAVASTGDDVFPGRAGYRRTAVWAAFIAVAFGAGAALRAAGALPVDPVPPLHASARLLIGPLVPASAVALAGVAVLPTIARRLRWRPLLAVAWLASALWAVILQWPDGVSRPLTAPTEYLAGLPAMGDHPLAWLRGFTRHLQEYPTHAKGHPPLPDLILWILRWTGLNEPVWAAALVIAVGTSSIAAIAMTIHTLADEETARRAVPFLVLAPMVICLATSMDALFLGVAAWSVTLTTKATAPAKGTIPLPPGGISPLQSSSPVDDGGKGFHRLWITVRMWAGDAARPTVRTARDVSRDARSRSSCDAQPPGSCDAQRPRSCDAPPPGSCDAQPQSSRDAQRPRSCDAPNSCAAPPSSSYDAQPPSSRDASPPSSRDTPSSCGAPSHGSCEVQLPISSDAQPNNPFDVRQTSSFDALPPRLARLLGVPHLRLPGLARRLPVAFGGGIVTGSLPYLNYGLVTILALPLAVFLLTRPRRAIVVGFVLGCAVVPLAFTLGGFLWWDGVIATHAAWAAGAGSDRPYVYFLVGDLAVLALIVGPVAAGALPYVLRRGRVLGVLVAAALLGVLALDLSGVTRGEVERIWLPYAAWLTAAGAIYRPPARRALLVQAVTALLIQALVRSPW